jgi:hypothetical protein
VFGIVEEGFNARRVATGGGQDEGCVAFLVLQVKVHVSMKQKEKCILEIKSQD